MRAYLNNEDRKRVLMLMAFRRVFEEVEQREKLKELFGEHFSDLKRGKSFIERALKHGLAPKLDEKQSKMIANMAKTHVLLLEGKAAPQGKEEVYMEADNFFDMAELAIGNNCTGCQLSDYQNCRVYQVLQRCEVPPADTKITNDDCPYKQ